MRCCLIAVSPAVLAKMDKNHQVSETFQSPLATVDRGFITVNLNWGIKWI